MQVVGFAAGGTEYVVEVEVDYKDRLLVAKEKKVIQNIYDRYGGAPQVELLVG